jgi:hypothetical protein
VNRIRSNLDAQATNYKELIMKSKLFAALGDRFAKLTALLFCISLTLPVFAQVGPVHMLPAASAISSTAPLSKGVKVLARVPWNACGWRIVISPIIP